MSIARVKKEQRRELRDRGNSISLAKLRKMSAQNRKAILEKQFTAGATLYTGNKDAILPDLDDGSSNEGE